jgi:hypothetical protein
VLWLHAFCSFTTPRSLFDCLVDRFGKPLRRFNAPTRAAVFGSAPTFADSLAVW